MKVIDELRAEQRPLAVMHYFDIGVLSEQEAMDALRYLHNEWHTDPSAANTMSESYLKCALTYMSFNKLGLMKK